MRRLVIAKLDRLEAAQNRRREAYDPAANDLAAEQACSQIRLYLESQGFVQREGESLAEAFGRSAGLNGRELNRLLSAD